MIEYDQRYGATNVVDNLAHRAFRTGDRRWAERRRSSLTMIVGPDAQHGGTGREAAGTLPTQRSARRSHGNDSFLRLAAGQPAPAEPPTCRPGRAAPRQSRWLPVETRGFGIAAVAGDSSAAG